MRTLLKVPLARMTMATTRVAAIAYRLHQMLVGPVVSRATSVPGQTVTAPQKRALTNVRITASTSTTT